MPELPAVSVIIPARDAAPTLRRTLNSLQAQTVAGRSEVIVVDDGSQDETAEIAHRHAPLVSVIGLDEAGGPGAARNRGVEAARAPVLAFTDADCFPAPDWLERGLAALERAALVQGRVEPDPAVPRTAFDRSLMVRRDRGFYQTANLFVRRELFDTVGGFRDWALERAGRRRWSRDRRRGRATRTPIGEDTLFAWEALRLGAVSSFAEDALVHHAVVPGTVADAAADRWHWTQDMPGLARMVPELRQAVFYRRWFFAHWSATFDLAVASVAAAAITRRPACLLGTYPYLNRVRREATSLGQTGGIDQAAWSALGAPVVDAVTLAGFLRGSVGWRTVVL
jgi:glycosyltransferase involved in cell wall biosynthesis